jgi:hypothetical protein
MGRCSWFKYIYFFQADDDVEVKPGSVIEHIDGGTAGDGQPSGDVDVAMDVEVVAEVRRNFIRC